MRSRNFCTTTNSARRPTLAVLIVFLIGACGESSEPSIEQHNPAGAALTLTHPVTVSGVSSGAYMAVQTHMALSDRVAGVGAVAGGPYHCAAGSVLHALGRCLSGEKLDVDELVSFTRESANRAEIAATENLRHAKVWIFNSPKDVVVGQRVAVALADFYRQFVSDESVRLVDGIDAAHGWPTLHAGSDCLELGGDFINACDFDTAGNLLHHLYGDLAPRVADVGSQELTSIDLSGYFASGSGVGDSGFIFVPNSCRDSVAGCRLHIAFHGCRQGAEFINDRFAANAGLNEWASSNQLVVVYPQIESSLMNPQGCWDWWGYTGPHYDQKNGEQIAGVDRIISAFASNLLWVPDI